MKNRRSNEHGFFTMIVLLILILAVAIFIAYSRVRAAQQG